MARRVTPPHGIVRNPSPDDDGPTASTGRNDVRPEGDAPAGTAGACPLRFDPKGPGGLLPMTSLTPSEDVGRQLDTFRADFDTLRKEVGRVIVGHEEIVDG